MIKYLIVVQDTESKRFKEILAFESPLDMYMRLNELTGDINNECVLFKSAPNTLVFTEIPYFTISELKKENAHE